MVSEITLCALWMLAAGDAEDVAQVVALNGQASVIHSHEADDMVALDLGGKLHPNDKITTQSSSWVRIVLGDGSVLDLGPDTALSIEVFRKQSDTRYQVRLRTWIGRMWAHVKSREEGDADFVVTTANAVASVRGTSFIVDSTGADTSTITTVAGHVSLSPGYLLGDAQPADVFAMQSASVEGTSWPPPITAISADNVRELRDALTPRPALDAASQYERLSRIESQPTLHGGSTQAAALPLQTTPTSMPGAVAPPLNLDQGARNAHVNATVQLQN